MAELDDDQLFTELSNGLYLCLANAVRLWRDCQRLLAANRSQAFNIIRIFVEEEAAKYLILLDAVRCPRQPSHVFSRQLGYFNNHLSKGLYAKYYTHLRPTDLTEIRNYMDHERRALYRDGPNDDDWIFRNDILREREESIYVDYVAYSDNAPTKHYWHFPDPQRQLLFGMTKNRPEVLDIALALHGVGMTNRSALATVAATWRPVCIDETILRPRIKELNRRTLDCLANRQLLRVRPKSVYARVINDWRCPLFPLDLSEIKPASVSDAQ